ncbi:hypothetical protein N657DRAFT_670636 [Parathielavia appendiculata]|uniref:Apple domain-containing protein n=1 Tax=Parathielavia appendiculata TaxID=2587402 RepID=A0AAN6U1J5_9PEZI|nr:hypothetical protein N657DRAFT_670636 [Parathielavia appendiculata]
MARGLRQLALLGLAALPGSLAGPADVTCVDKASDQSTYAATSGAVFQILCGIDYAGSDMAAVQASTFAGCIDACDSTPGCIDVSYAGDQCYLKNKVTDALQRDWVWTAKQAASDNKLTCVDKKSDKDTYTTSTGAVFEVQCGIDYVGGDVAATTTATFEDCIDACAATAGCLDVSYVGEACYMKNKLEAALERDWVWTAKLVESGSGSGQEDPEPLAKLSCDGNASNGQIYKATNADFEITCFKDYAGGDLLGLSTASFEECIDACDSHVECVNVAYVYGACYLKKQQNPAVDSVSVWGAVRKPATSATTGTTTATSTTATAVSTPSSTKTPLTCEGNASNLVKYTSAKSGLYQILCGVDFGGNDLAATTAATFEDCIAACDENTDCVDVSYVAPSCYLKKALGDMTQVGHVWTAKQLQSPGSVFSFPTVTPMDPGSGTEENFEGPFEFEPAPIATLGPVPPPGVNMAGTGVLTPDPVSELWYNGTQSESDGSDLGPVTVRLNITYNYASIVLDHSIYIRDVVCSAGTLHGRFNSSYPFFFAQDTWQTDEDVLLITSAPSCGDDAAQNAFFLAHTISFQESSFSFEALGQIVELKDVFADLNIDFGNITVSTPADEEQQTCGSPSADTLRGLPAVPCGTNFDNALDDKLGYYSDGGRDAQAVLSLAAPTQDDSQIQRRGWGWLKSIVSAVKTVAAVVTKAVQVVVNVVKTVATAVVNVVKAAATFVVNTAVAVAKVAVSLAVNAVKLVAFAVTGQYENSLTLPVNLGPPSSVQVESPWGKAFKMYTFKMGGDDEKFSATKAVLDNLVDDLIGSPEPEPGVEIYCVNCGARGSIKATGKINATPLSGVKEAYIGVTGNMYIGMYLGVNGFAKWEKEWEKEIFSKGLPGWSIPGIVTLGPKITLSGKFVIGVEAEGQVLTGASLNWPGFEAKLDLKNSRNSYQKGWTPNIDHTFQTRGAVTATAALGLPVSLWFGIDILNGLFKEGIALVDTPAITGTAEFEVNVGTEETSVGSDECKGIAWDIKLTNEVTLEVDDGPEWKLAEWASPALAEGCIGYTPSGGSDDDGGSGNPPDVPDLPPADDGTITCPKYDGQTYTDDKGNQWAIRCNYDYMYFDTQQIWTDTMNECLAWCATQSNCAGVSYGTAGAAGHWNCWARSRAGPARAGPYHSMMLMSPFEITSVIFGTADITAYAVQNWQVGNRIEINTNTVNQAGGQDRLPGTQKSIFMLYRYGAETRTWVGLQNSGIVTIYPGAISSAPSSSMLVPDWPASSLGLPNWIRIIDVCYGRSQIRNKGAWDTIYRAAYNGQTSKFVNELLGDTWVGTVKTAVIWYRDTRFSQDGPLYYATGVEGDGFRLMGPGGNFKRQLSLGARQEGDASNSTTGAGPYSNSTLFSNTTAPTASDVEFGNGIATVRDTTGSLQLLPANNGNLFLAPLDTTEELSLLTNNTVLNAMTLPSNADVPYLVNSDSADRLLHYFPDEVALVGASRLRLAAWDHLPLGSHLINLVPIMPADEGSATEPVLVAIDGAGEGDYLFPVMCAIGGQLNKVFLVKDTSEAALKALEDEDLKFVLTGGQASQCGPLALVASITPVVEAATR